MDSRRTITLPYTATPAGICEAARAGDATAIDLLLAHRPELLTINNPHNWTKTADGHEVRGSYNKKPVEVAAFFNHPESVAKLLEISRDSQAIMKPWRDHLPFDGHFNALSIARSLNHTAVIEVIQSDVMKRLYVNPKLLNHSEDDGRSVLHYAAEQGHMPLVRDLLTRGAEPDTPNKSGRRVIHSVLDCGANADAGDNDPHAVARQLIELGAKYDLWIATSLGDIERVKEILSVNSSKANEHFRPDQQGYSNGLPLVRACSQGNREIVELLLDHGADANATIPIEEPCEFGMPLIAAVYAKHYEIAHLLLDREASVYAYPNCAAPFVDMLYYASVESSPDWLALSELKHATDDASTHEQPNNSGATDAVTLYERVLKLGGEPQMYSHVKMKNHGEIKRLLKEQPEAMGKNPGGPNTIFNCLSHAAAWLGDATTMELCLTLQPKLHSPDASNYHISAAIRSHNRDGSFAEYRRIIEMNLEYLRSQNAPITGTPLFDLADDFLENYSYGTNPDLPAMDDLLNLAELFIEYGADVNERHEKSGRTALTQAVNEGQPRYVELLLKHGAEVHRNDPAQTNPVSLARKHGFVEILKLLGESTEPPIAPVILPGNQTIEAPTASKPPIIMSPLNNAIIRLGVIKVIAKFQPLGTKNDTKSVFVEFPEPFPADEFANVRLLITNRSNPQIIASATTGTRDGVQGFLLKARNSMRKDGMPAGMSNVVDSVSFSWMAVLPTDQPQPQQFDVRYGLIPWRESPAHELHTYDDTANLYADEPFDASTGEKHAFLTSTESNVINGAAARPDERGIAHVSAYQISRHDGGGRMYWMVIAERSQTATANAATDATTSNNFDANNLWIHASRAEPVNFIPAGIPGAWRTHWMEFRHPFRERKPCVFVTANSHDVTGHHSSVVAMSWECTRSNYRITGLTIDPLRGQSNFDCVSIGHCDVPADEVAASSRRGMRKLTPWQRQTALDGCEDTAYEMAASGAIGVNEFNERGVSLLAQAVYERHERTNTALARRLFALGADPNQAHPVTQLGPLHLAAIFNRVDMCNLLIERGANVNATTAAGTTSSFPSAYDCSRVSQKPIPRHRGETGAALRHGASQLSRCPAVAGCRCGPER